MATKSVIEIEIIDEQFKAFDVQLKAIQAIVASLPNQWKAVTKEVKEEQKAEKKAADEAEKARKKRLQEEKDYNKIIEDRKKSFMDAAHFTGNIAKNLASGALSIAKWTAFAAIGGGFGLAGLSSSASDYRRRSQALGTTTGGLRAAETNLGSYIDPNTVLNNIATLQHDITQQFALTRLGGKRGGDPLDQLQTVMENAIKDFTAHGKDINYAQNVGLTKIFSPEELLRLSSLSAEELQKTWKQLAHDREAFKVSDETSRKWQMFLQQLGRAGQSIQTLLIDKLQNLVVPLTELSKTIIEVIANFLKNNQVSDWIKGFGQSIKDFAEYLGKPEFKQDIDDFITNVAAMAEEMANLLRKIGLVPEKTYRTTSADIDAVQAARPNATPQEVEKVAKGINEQRRYAIDRFMAAGLPREIAVGFAANIEAESGFNIGVKNKSGHFGLAQWDETRQKEFTKFAGHSIKSSNRDEQLDFILYELKNNEKKAWEEIGKTYQKGGNYQDYTKIIGQKYEKFGDDPKEFQRRADIANRIAMDTHLKPENNSLDVKNAMQSYNPNMNVNVNSNLNVTVNNNTDTNVAVKQLTNK